MDWFWLANVYTFINVAFSESLPLLRQAKHGTDMFTCTFPAKECPIVFCELGPTQVGEQVTRLAFGS
jgi:hypothetical protein